MMSFDSMVCRAASLDAFTTKSVNVRPCISAARLSIAWTCAGKRASSLAVWVLDVFMLLIYGKLPDRVNYFLVVRRSQNKQPTTQTGMFGLQGGKVIKQ